MLGCVSIAIQEAKDHIQMKSKHRRKKNIVKKALNGKHK
jgi:hypothetical protein